MKYRLTALATAVVLAACGETPTEPDASFVALPQLSVTTSAPISNPSFEQGYTGWTFTSVDVGAFWATTDGVNSVDLNAFAAGSISQDITTTPGVDYTVVFDLAGNPGWPRNLKVMEVSAGGTSAVYSFDTTGRSGGSVASMGWREESFTFTATGATTTLTFKSLHEGSPYIWQDRAQGAAVDNVRVFFEAPDNPHTKDDCKKGGWEQYGFRNQGQCVRYIETGKDSR